MDKNKISIALREIVNLLVKHEFDQLVENDNEKVLTADEIKNAIDQYPGVLTMPPIETFEKFHLYEITETECTVEFELWKDNLESDLTLSCHFWDQDGSFKYSIEDIHVL